MISGKALQELNNTVQALIAEGVVNKNIGTVDNPIPVTIESVDDHAVGRMKERGITEADAQSYIDGAMVMFRQSNDAKRLYVSNDGNSAILVEGNRLISAYSSSDFDAGMRRVINEVGKHG